MNIQIKDDFDLKKIADSGQCFRVREMDDGYFRFITGENILYIRKCADAMGENTKLMESRLRDESAEYEISCSIQEWENTWKPYFDMDRNYKKVRSKVKAGDAYMENAVECGKGIRILRQDPWEMLISFIISQRKSIPAIKTSIEMICERYGKKIVTDMETEVYSFPDATSIVERPELLEECKLGYRLKYIQDAARRVALKEIDLDVLGEFDSQQLLIELKTVYGVGDKVANCIALFAYNRCELAPVDTWIRKVMDNEYAGNNPFPGYGDVAGIMQQYIFYYAQTHKEEF